MLIQFFFENNYPTEISEKKRVPEFVIFIFKHLKEGQKSTFSLVNKIFNQYWTSLVSKITPLDNCTNEDFVLLASKFPNITSLNLRLNRKVTEGISIFKNLISLDLSANYLPGSPLIKSHEIANLTYLISLSLFRNECIDDSGVCNLINLTDLNLDGNEKITDEGIRNLTQNLSFTSSLKSALF